MTVADEDLCRGCGRPTCREPAEPLCLACEAVWTEFRASAPRPHPDTEPAPPPEDRDAVREAVYSLFAPEIPATPE